MSLRFPHLSPQKTPPLRPSVRTPSLPLVESPIPKSYVRGFFSSATLRCTWGTCAPFLTMTVIKVIVSSTSATPRSVAILPLAAIRCSLWHTLVAPSPLSRHGRRVKMDAFLAEINLAQHATILDKLGYDDPNDFAEFEASDLKKLETRCADEGMPPAHVDKIVRAVKKRSAVAAAAATSSVTPAPAPALTSSPLTLLHAALPIAGLATPSPMAVVQQAALDVGQAARSLRQAQAQAQ